VSPSGTRPARISQWPVPPVSTPPHSSRAATQAALAAFMFPWFMQPSPGTQPARYWFLNGSDQQGGEGLGGEGLGGGGEGLSGEGLGGGGEGLGGGGKGEGGGGEGDNGMHTPQDTAQMFWISLHATTVFICLQLFTLSLHGGEGGGGEGEGGGDEGEGGGGEGEGCDGLGDGGGGLGGGGEGLGGGGEGLGGGGEGLGGGGEGLGGGGEGEGGGGEGLGGGGEGEGGGGEGEGGGGEGGGSGGGNGGGMGGGGEGDGGGGEGEGGGGLGGVDGGVEGGVDGGIIPMNSWKVFQELMNSRIISMNSSCFRSMSSIFPSKAPLQDGVGAAAPVTAAAPTLPITQEAAINLSRRVHLVLGMRRGDLVCPGEWS